MHSMRRWLGLGIVVLSLAALQAAAQTPVGTAFTFQGELTNNGELINEDCDFEFRLYDAPAIGNQVGAMIPVNAQAVENGRFTVVLDFGAQFTGQARWLQISVRLTNGGGVFTTLAPRQELTPAPYALGLSLPFLGIADDNLGSAFEIVNNDFGWAGVFRNNNPANTDAALNVTSMSGPAGQFFHDAGGFAISARVIGSADSIYSESPSGRALLGRITNPNAPAPATALHGENLSLQSGIAGVWGTAAGSGYGVRGTSLSGRGVFGETTSDFGFGVFGSGAGRSGVGVYGIHTDTMGESPGVDGVTNSTESKAAGVRGRANGGGTQAVTTYGVLGTSASMIGIGVRGESNTGVSGVGDETGVSGVATDIGGEGVYGEGTFGVYGLGNDGGAGVKGEAGNGSTFGVWAIGGLGGRIGAPALRADGGSGPAIYALGVRAIEGEGDEFGVRGVTWDENGYGGTFTNYAEGGVALRASGRTEIEGELSCHVLEILGADVAEKFPVTEPVEPGTVVAIDPANPGKLCLARGAYNRCVAGIVSGGNGLPAGTILGHLEGSEGQPPIALSGRVWVHCDASAHAIEPGDLLTTSDVAGKAMKASDPARMHGAIIGKAMTGLARGEQGMVLVLVNLH